MSAPRPTRSTTAEGTADARISFSATERRMRDDTTIGLYHPRRAIAGRWWNLRFPQRAKLAEPPSAYARTPARAGLWPAWQTLRTNALESLRSDRRGRNPRIMG